MIDICFSSLTAQSLQTAITRYQRSNILPPKLAIYPGQQLLHGRNTVLDLNFFGDTGNIQCLPDWQKRSLKLIKAITPNVTDTYQELIKNTLTKTWENFDILTKLTKKNETIRVWWSDHPNESCGFHWLCHHLENYSENIYNVKIPLECPGPLGGMSFGGTGEFPPEELTAFLPKAMLLTKEERFMYARRWQYLTEENAPLRAVLNGHLQSVSEDFYDFAFKHAENVLTDPSQLLGSAVMTLYGSAPEMYLGRRIAGLMREKT